MKTYVYEFGDSLYINLTNRCCNNCEFCVRNNSDGVGGNNLRLEIEPTVDEVLDDLSMYPLKNYKEIVFCGLGEPLYRLSEIMMIAPKLKKQGLKTRINTNGLAALINKREDIPKLLASFIDTISISLNASNADDYNFICRPKFANSFDAMLKFAKGCVDEGIHTVLSIVDFVGEEEIEKCREIAKDIGAEYRVRETIY
ncbi:MAG TPA: TatD family nuclease-associated radical SAM protein [Clostridia bacterium]|nr:TatD family nuclease-associated radical SAM protein [Clostridia bacterium]